MPNSFLKSTARGCAILCSVNPDGFAFEFGFHVRVDRCSEGLGYLLENRKWEEQGNRGRTYVKEHFEKTRTIDLHVKVYDRLFAHPDGAG